MDDQGNNSQIAKLENVHVKKFLEEEGISDMQLKDDIKTLAWVDVYDHTGKKARKSCWYTKSPCTCKYSYGNSCWTANDMPKWMTSLANALFKNVQSRCSRGVFRQC